MCSLRILTLGEIDKANPLWAKLEQNSEDGETIMTLLASIRMGKEQVLTYL